VTAAVERVAEAVLPVDQEGCWNTGQEEVRSGLAMEDSPAPMQRRITPVWLLHTTLTPLLLTMDK
jgi:hypothetical protein